MMVSGHPFELDAARHHGHQSKTPRKLPMDLTFIWKGAITTAYAIGVTMQKNNWAT
jgi:hypothetical protein